MHRLARSRRSERGQILVIVAGGLIGLLAIAALALEGGTIILSRRDGQNASDLGALAGTRMVSLNYTDGGRNQQEVFEAIEDSMELNNCGSTASAPCVWEAEFVAATGGTLSSIGSVNNIAATLPTNTVGVRVGVTRSPGTHLGRIFAIDHWDVSTEGTALTGKSPGVPGGVLLPIALCGFGPDNAECEQANGSNAKPFVAGEVFSLTDGKVGPGNFGWLSWTGANDANSLETSLCNANNPPFTLDSLTDAAGDWEKNDPLGTNSGNGETWFPGGNGKMNSSGVRGCLNNWISSGATVLIPIYDVTSHNVPGGGHGANDLAYHIVGIAAFVLTAIDQPAVDQIQGRFVEYFPITSVPGGLGWQTPSPDDVTTFIGLVK
jgi:hypothetical protein